MSGLFEIDWAEKLAEVERELVMRRRVYPRSVSSGKLSQERADRGIAVMEAIAEDYRNAIARKAAS